jgi:hypothetical protein
MVVQSKEDPHTRVVFTTTSKIIMDNDGNLHWRFETVEKEGYTKITNLTFHPISDGRMQISGGGEQYLEEHPNSGSILIYTFDNSQLRSLETISLRGHSTRVRVHQTFSGDFLTLLTVITEKNIEAITHT